MSDAVFDLAAIVVDVADPGPVSPFYVTAAAGEVVRDDPDGVWIKLNGINVIFRQVPDYRPPSWPDSTEQMQVHFDFNVDDVVAARLRLEELGARTAEHQPHDPELLKVMVDPAGHLFCIGPRV
jgi:hypothetical protein